MRWSILLPTHNREDTLPLAIESVLSQTQNDFELLVVGDGCSDDSAGVIGNFNDSRVKWFDLPKAPFFGYANRNMALREAKGELIAFMAHDDIWLPDHLLLLEDSLTDPKIDFAYTRPTWITPDGMVFPIPFNLEDLSCLNQFLNFKLNCIPAGNIAHKRECFEKCGYWNEELQKCGDWDMWTRIIKSSIKPNFRYIPETSNLHFRANWRTDLNEGPKDMLFWRELFQKFKYIPSEVKVEIPLGEIEQKVFFKLIKDDPSYTSRLRSAILNLIDLRARYSVNLNEKLPSLERHSSLKKFITRLAPRFFA